MKIYLAGGIFNRSDAGAKDWREKAKSSLHHECLDPMRRDYRGCEHLNYQFIVEQDKREIDECDALLVHFSHPSVGTSMEILYAWERQKKVYLVNASDKPLSPWLLYHSHVVFNNLDKTIEVLNNE